MQKVIAQLIKEFVKNYQNESGGRNQVARTCRRFCSG